MPLKKSELYSSLWCSCDELRGGMDASQYKDYVLILFVNLRLRQVRRAKGHPRRAPEQVFVDTVALKSDREIGGKVNKLIDQPRPTI